MSAQLDQVCFCLRYLVKNPSLISKGSEHDWAGANLEIIQLNLPISQIEKLRFQEEKRSIVTVRAGTRVQSVTFCSFPTSKKGSKFFIFIKN